MGFVRNHEASYFIFVFQFKIFTYIYIYTGQAVNEASTLSEQSRKMTAMINTFSWSEENLKSFMQETNIFKRQNRTKENNIKREQFFRVAAGNFAFSKRGTTDLTVQDSMAWDRPCGILPKYKCVKHGARQLVLEAVWLGRAFLWCQLWRSLQQHLWTQWLCVSLLMLCFGEHVSFSVFGFQFPFEWDKSKSFLAVKITFDLYIYAKIRSAGVQC